MCIRDRNEGARAIAEGAPQITHLDLANNLIDDEGAGAIARHLVNLTVLNLSFNSIDDDGCLAITRALPNLRRLELRANRIGDGGIAVIGNLTLLNRLDLGHNRICSRGAIAIAAQLPSLIGLNLTHNSIGGEGAIAIANRCFHLTGLNLAHNNIEERGISGLLDALGEVSHGWLRTLDLSGNPGLEHLGMPELVDSVDAQAILATRSELREAQFRGGVPFGEAKLVVLGDGAVGKTSLLNALINHVACDPTESKTPGVEHRVWNPRWTIPSGPGQAEVRRNGRGFGGAGLGGGGPIVDGGDTASGCCAGHLGQFEPELRRHRSAGSHIGGDAGRQAAGHGFAEYQSERFVQRRHQVDVAGAVVRTNVLDLSLIHISEPTRPY